MKARDSGTYECMADNVHGTSTDKVQVRVQPKSIEETKNLPKATVKKTEDIRVLRQGMLSK